MAIIIGIPTDEDSDMSFAGSRAPSPLTFTPGDPEPIEDRSVGISGTPFNRQLNVGRASLLRDQLGFGPDFSFAPQNLLTCGFNESPTFHSFLSPPSYVSIMVERLEQDRGELSELMGEQTIIAHLSHPTTDLDLQLLVNRHIPRSTSQCDHLVL